jgi:hypothetical protein
MSIKLERSSSRHLREISMLIKYVLNVLYNEEKYQTRFSFFEITSAILPSGIINREKQHRNIIH